MKPVSPLRPAIRAILLFTVFALPLLVNLWGWDRVEMPRITLLKVSVLVCYLLWVCQPNFRMPTIRINSILIPLVMVAGISTALSVNGVRSYAETVNLLAYVGFFYLIYAGARDPGFRRQLATALLASAFVIGLYGVGQHWGYDPLHWRVPAHVLRKTFSTFGNRIFLAAYFAMLIPLALVAAATAKRRGVQALALVTLLLITACLLFSYSRAGWGAAVVGLAVLLPLVARSRVPGVLRACLLCLGLMALLAVGAEVLDRLSGESMVARVGTIVGGQESSAAYHNVHWGTTFQMMGSMSTSSAVHRGLPALTRALLGWGPGTYDLVLPEFAYVNEMAVVTPTTGVPYQNPHCDLLLMGATLGLIGLVLWVRLMVRVCFLSQSVIKRMPRDESLAMAGWIACFAAYLAQSMFTPRVVGTQMLLWACLGVICAAVANVLPGFAKEQEEAEKAPSSLPTWGRRLVAALLLVVAVFPANASQFRPALREKSLDSRFAPSWLVPLAADYHLKRAVRLRDAGDFDAAFKQHQTSISYEPLRSVLWYSTGETCLAAARTSPEHWRSWMIVAQRCYQYLINNDPSEGLAHKELGNALFVGGLLSAESAEARAKDGSGVEQPSSPAQQWFKGSESEYRKCIALWPRISSVHHGLAKALQAQGRTEDALQTYLRAIELGSTWGEPEANLGSLYWRLGLPKPAIFCLKLALRQSPQDNPFLDRYHKLLKEMEAAVKQGNTDPTLLERPNLF
ncbi:MAG TPA: O-antigen ligase family protein [Armatimonadota bacterium]